MKHISVSAANNLYICASNSSIHRHKIYHSLFYEFCRLIDKLEYDLDEQAHDDYWKGFLREVRYYRFLLNAVPLSMDSQAAQLLSSMQDNLRRCRYSFPQFVHHIENMVNKLTILSGSHDNPLLEAVLGIVSSQDQVIAALLLKEPYLLPLVEDVLATHTALEHIELVDQYQLRGAHCYNQVIIIGPSRWYPEYILRAPRTKEIHLIHYSWLADAREASPIFVKSFTQQQPGSRGKLTGDLQARIEDNSNELIETPGQDILPEINWSGISTKILRQTQEDISQEYIPAKLYLLASEQAVFLDANENTKVLVLDLEIDEDEEEELHQIKRISLSKVRPGMFLLLRTEGGGDYIVPIANRILRDKALPLRAMQDQWKGLLKRAVETRGLLAVSIELLDYGSKRANETNVRNWMSIRSIHPHDDEDFRAILKLAGFEGKAQEYQDAAEQIESAHRKAGFYIREQLLKQVPNADLRELHKRGFMDFELPEADGGSLTAYRIEHISPEVSSIPASRIGRPATIKDLLWH